MRYVIFIALRLIVTIIARGTLSDEWQEIEDSLDFNQGSSYMTFIETLYAEHEEHFDKFVFSPFYEAHNIY